MKMFSVLALAVTASLVWTSTGLAADTKTQIWKSPELIGKTVKNTKGETLGSVEDVVIDVKQGKIVYVAVAHGEVLGFGGKLFAVDPRHFYMSQDNSCAVLEVTKGDFDKADGFDANKWPTEPDQRWNPKKDGKEEGKKEVKEALDKVKDTKDSKDRELRRVSSIQGMAVHAMDNSDLGRVRGLALNLLEEKVVYAAVAYGGVAGVGTKYFAVSWNALEMKSPDLKDTNKVFFLDANKADLDKKAGFDWNNWPMEPDNSFKARKSE